MFPPRDRPGDQITEDKNECCNECEAEHRRNVCPSIRIPVTHARHLRGFICAPIAQHPLALAAVSSDHVRALMTGLFFHVDGWGRRGLGGLSYGVHMQLPSPQRKWNSTATLSLLAGPPMAGTKWRLHTLCRASISFCPINAIFLMLLLLLPRLQPFSTAPFSFQLAAFWTHWYERINQ